jgi:hypothetical protein
MLRLFTLLTLVALLLSGCTALSLSEPGQLLEAPVAQAAVKGPVVACDVTPTLMDEPPKDPHADPFGYGNWHINAERTMWVMIPPSGKWHTSGEKVIWIRPAGTELVVSGQRIDAKAEPLRVDQPCCYSTGFQVNGLHFPTGGCWEVVATAGEHELRFIIEVVESDEQSWAQPSARGVDPSSPLATSVLVQSCGINSCELNLFDTETGSVMEKFEPLALGRYATFGPSTDLTQLALIVYRDNSYLRNGQLSFVDLATWEVVTTTLTFNGAYNPPLFTTGNSRLLVLTQEESYLASDVVHLVDVASGTMLAEQALNFYPTSYQFTPDESGIMIFGTKGTSGESYVALLDAESLEFVWEEKVEGLLNGTVMKEGSTDPMEGRWMQPASVFAKDSATLYVVHADQEQLTTVDFDAQSMSTQAITEQLSWIERLLMLTARTAYAKMANGVNKQAMISPDGTKLYVIGTDYRIDEDSQFVQTGLGLQVIDIASGVELAHIETEAQSLTLDPVSGRLYLHGWTTAAGRPYSTEWTEVLDATTLEQINILEERAVAVARRFDGMPLLLTTTTLENGKTELAVLDPQSFETISSMADWYNGGYVGWIVLR